MFHYHGYKAYVVLLSDARAYKVNEVDLAPLLPRLGPR